MTDPKGAARAWLEITRISNLPTVLSNAIAGAAIGAGAGWGLESGRPWIFAPGAMWWAIAAPALAYLGGMVLNDAFDASIDASERPSRPIPSGRITRVQAFAAGFLLLALSLVACHRTGSSTAFGCTLALAASVVVYNMIHAATAASVILLAACRALGALIPLIVFHGESFHWKTPALALPGALAVWTLGLSMLARREMSAASIPAGTVVAIGYAIRLFFAIACFAAILSSNRRGGPFPPQAAIWASVAIAFVTAIFAHVSWRRLRRGAGAVRRAVGRMIVCLALIDATFVTASGDPLSGALCLALALLADRAQRRVAPT
jgi:4-hydroxybenzoate polyprenyltransferase